MQIWVLFTVKKATSTFPIKKGSLKINSWEHCLGSSEINYSSVFIQQPRDLFKGVEIRWLDSRKRNYLKSGVVLKKNFDYNSIHFPCDKLWTFQLLSQHFPSLTLHSSLLSCLCSRQSSINKTNTKFTSLLLKILYFDLWFLLFLHRMKPFHERFAFFILFSRC